MGTPPPSTPWFLLLKLSYTNRQFSFLYFVIHFFPNFMFQVLYTIFKNYANTSLIGKCLKVFNLYQFSALLVFIYIAFYVHSYRSNNLYLRCVVVYKKVKNFCVHSRWFFYLHNMGKFLVG